MHLESLVRLIESADFMTFRAIALEYLLRKGYASPSLSDGWRDGGSDIRVTQLPPNPTKMAVQVSIERAWQRKVRTDAFKVRDRLGLKTMLFVSSRRVPEADFNSVAETIWREAGVQVIRHDSQTIATQFFLDGASTTVLRLMGIAPDQAVAPASPPNLRTSAVCSFLFFGKEVHRFQEGMVESAILAAASDAGADLERTELECKARDILGAGVPLKVVSGAVDRLHLAGQVHLRSGRVSIDAASKDGIAAAHLLHERERREVVKAVDAFLTARCGRSPDEDDIAAVLEDLGALLIAAATDVIRSVGYKGRATKAFQTVNEKVRHLNATLDILRAPEGGRDVLITDLATVVAKSPAGRQLMAGELYLQLAGLRKRQFITALGGSAEVSVILDASVAIPMLCSVLYEPVSQRFSLAAHQLYEQLARHGIATLLPSEYLEEVSTHLVDAARYAGLVEVDPDLALSENAFVAHYAALRPSGRAPAYDQYLADFGLVPALRQADFYVQRDTLRPRLSALFARYNIRFFGLPALSRDSRKWAELEVMHALTQGGLDRPTILVRHDVRVLTWLQQVATDPDVVHVLCTWDRLHFAVRGSEDLRWEALNPAVLADLLSLVSTDEADTLVSPLVLARSVTDRAAEEGARILDTILKIEKGRVFDAELIRQAHGFKQQYIASRNVNTEYQEVEKAWLKWKARPATVVG